MGLNFKLSKNKEKNYTTINKPVHTGSVLDIYAALVLLMLIYQKGYWHDKSNKYKGTRCKPKTSCGTSE